LIFAEKKAKGKMGKIEGLRIGNFRLFEQIA